MTSDMVVLSFPDAAGQASMLAASLLSEQGRVSAAEITVHRFPDGESRVAVPVPLPDHVVILCSLNQPN